MDQPTSQCVGREFVRQYYTVLHEAPLDMHRFYTDKSSYLHGGDEQAGHELPPVCGQSNIYEKIKSLNFQSCHAKIRQVDSHMSVEDSVVVQVSGELSNNGERMRRFMQTFVLVPLTPKNYYVHNDIFRYQDQVFQQIGISAPVDVQTEIDSINDEINIECENEYYEEEQEDIQHNNYENHTEQPYIQEMPENSEHLMNGNDSEMVYNQNEFINNEEDHNSHLSAETEEAIEEPRPQSPEPIEIINDVAPLQPMQPMSWAARASKNSTNPIKSKSVDFIPEKDNYRVEARMSNMSLKEDDRPLQSRIPDNQQVFVGNIPLNATENGLKKFFDQYGEVIHIKLNNKTKPTAQGLFAFVCYSNPSFVHKVLKSAPLKFDGQNINVEEKKDSSKKFVNNPNSKNKSRNNSRGLINKSKGQMITAGGRN